MQKTIYRQINVNWTWWWKLDLKIFLCRRASSVTHVSAVLEKQQLKLDIIQVWMKYFQADDNLLKRVCTERSLYVRLSYVSVSAKPLDIVVCEVRMPCHDIGLLVI